MQVESMEMRAVLKAFVLIACFLPLIRQVSAQSNTKIDSLQQVIDRAQGIEKYDP
jgi:hypothetical protein